MNNTSFIRKIVYLVIMAGLLVPLYLISAPSFLRGNERSEGGLLTQLRDKHGLSQANLGEIDPASESMKLATLGMRGVAANLLWERANEYKKREEWDNLRATLNQIAKLQPNFISVWQFQAWNLSYNVSVEFDNYEHRYHWVKKGIEFLLQGIKYNRNEPRLLWDLGWFFGHKFGRSDEYKQFRRKYGTDGDFHDSLTTHIDVDEARDYKDEPDNWKTAYQWFSEAQRVVDLEGVPIRGKNPLVFHSDSAKSLIRYADAIESEGVFGEVAKLAWEEAYARWMKYGEREIPTSYGYKIRLNEGENWNERAANLKQQLEDLAPGKRAEITMRRLAQLTDEERRLLKADRAGLEPAEYDIAVTAAAKAAVTPDDIVKEIEDSKTRREAKLLVNRILEAEAYATTIRRYRDVVNYNYWKTRTEVERENRAIEARKNLYEAKDAFAMIDLFEAKAKYEEAWKRWATIHEDYPILADDVTAEDLVDEVKNYRTLLRQLDLKFPPDDFPMLRLVANYADDLGFSDEEAAKLLAQADEMDARKKSSNDAPSDDSEATSTSDSEAAEENPESKKTTLEESTDKADDAQDPHDDDRDQAAETSEEAKTSLASELATAETRYLDADLEGARDAYADGLKQVAGQLESLSDDDRQSLIKHVRQYRILLGQLDAEFPPADFPLGDLVKEFAADFGYSDDEAKQLFGE